MQGMIAGVDDLLNQQQNTLLAMSMGNLHVSERFNSGFP